MKSEGSLLQVQGRKVLEGYQLHHLKFFRAFCDVAPHIELGNSTSPGRMYF